RRQEWRRGGALCSFAKPRKAQARQEEFALPGIVQELLSRHHGRGDLAQVGDDLACLVQPPHMGVTGCQNPSSGDVSGYLPQRRSQQCDRFLEAMLKEIARADPGIEKWPQRRTR